MQSRNKASNDGFQGFEELDKNKKRMEDSQAAQASDVQKTIGAAVSAAVDVGVRKTPLEKARERHAANKKNSREMEDRAKGKGPKPGPAGAGTGANATKVN